MSCHRTDNPFSVFGLTVVNALPKMPSVPA